MDNKYRSTTYATIVQALSLLVLGAVMVAGLWPFHAPRNAVTWLKDENGVRFTRHGTLVSRGPFRAVPSQTETSCSLEIWLTPVLVTSEGTILAFDSSPDPRTPFSLRQYGSSVAIQRYMIDERGIPRRPWLKVDRVFRQGDRVMLTVTSGRGVTVVYVDGVLAAQSSTLGLVREDLTGRLVLANSTFDSSWPGEVDQLAIYNLELTPTQVKRHFDSRMRNQQPMGPGDETPTALYLLNERDGKIAHNQMNAETDLIIPTRYLVLHPAFLGPLWDQFKDSGAAWRRWSYWKDIAVNVAGFIPLGFVFMAYVSSVSGLQRSTLVIIIVGFVVSFTIEVLQYFLPTRDSSISDLITNTAGTAMGVVLYRLPWVQSLVGRTRQYVTSLCQDGQGGINICLGPVTTRCDTRHEVS
jgi:VanZ like family/Concanavalin A-like lectin/glucanases superfamily